MLILGQGRIFENTVEVGETELKGDLELGARFVSSSRPTARTSTGGRWLTCSCSMARNVNHALVEGGWCWWYRKYAPSDTGLEGFEHEAREGRRERDVGGLSRRSGYRGGRLTGRGGGRVAGVRHSAGSRGGERGGGLRHPRVPRSPDAHNYQSSEDCSNE